MTQPKNKPARFGGIRWIMKHWQNGSVRQVLSDWKWIMGFAGAYRGAVVLYTILGILSATMGLLSAVASKYSIDIIVLQNASGIARVLAIMIVSMLLSIVLRNVISLVSVKISVRVNNDIQASVYHAVMKADWMALSEYQTGDLLNRLSSDISTVANNAISWLPDLLVNVYSFLATFFVIWYYDHVMALIALASAPFLILSSRRLLGQMRDHNRNLKEVSSELMAYESESLYNLDTIKSVGAVTRNVSGLKTLQERYWDASLAYNRFSIRVNVMLSVLGSVVRLVIFCYCLYLLCSGQIVYGTMTLFVSQGVKLSGLFNSLAAMQPVLLSSAVSARRIRELENLPPEPEAPEEDVLAAGAEAGLSVYGEGISFAYRQETPVLRHGDFYAKTGEIVAVVGPSGEGKTTLIRLMLGLVRPTEGRIYLRDQVGNTEEMNPDTRQYFSYVPQGNTMISGTIADNLRVGKENATEEEMICALKAACAWEFVSQRPGGLSSNVGQRGRGLSEGQAQRIAIARAVLRDAPVLLLDEAASALDMETERQVLKNIITSNPNKTCILTTHRSNVLNLCHRVYRVEHQALRCLEKEEYSSAPFAEK